DPERPARRGRGPAGAVVEQVQALRAGAAQATAKPRATAFAHEAPEAVVRCRARAARHRDERVERQHRRGHREEYLGETAEHEAAGHEAAGEAEATARQAGGAPGARGAETGEERAVHRVPSVASGSCAVGRAALSTAGSDDPRRV